MAHRSWPVPTPPEAEPTSKAVTDITKYCQTCWRNARLPADRWQDCTQAVFVRLLERVEADKWGTVLVDSETAERREGGDGVTVAALAN